MFEFSKIDKELKIYKENDVIIFGASKAGNAVKHLLNRHGIEIAAYVDNDTNKVGDNIEGVRIISLDECVEYFHKHENMVIQIGSTYEKEIAEQLKNRGIDRYIWYSEFKDRMKALNRLICCQKEPELKAVFDEVEWKYNCSLESDFIKSEFINNFQYTGNIRLMLSAPKVGNTTVVNSVERRGENIISLFHSYKYMDVSMQNLIHQYPVKLIMGVREPIKQNLSLLYELVSGGGGACYYDLDEYWNAGGDVRGIFNKYLIQDISDKKCWLAELNRRRECDWLVQHFFEQQIQPFFGVDIYQYPFDKENGFSIYHINDKLDIMIYQLEKLSRLGTEIGDFLGIENLELVTGNDSGEKWYKESYLNVEKNMPIDKKYFEDCYTSKYIEHFYSVEDINKFKAKWKVEGV